MNKSVREKAMDFLANREHSQFELARKLQSKGYEEDEIFVALEQLTQDRLLCDERFAESFIHSRLNRGQGPLKIKMELKQRGVNDDIIRQYMEKQSTDWTGLAMEVKRKRFGDSLPDDYKERMRQARFLQQRGFNQEHIQAVLNSDELE
jgi:regulatory protein